MGRVIHDEDAHLEAEQRQLQAPKHFRREPLLQARELDELRQLAVLLIDAVREVESLSHRGFRTSETNPRCPVAGMMDDAHLFCAV